ncbi:hypothetical protein AaE_000131, partial [Aphanomyces astaci]
MCISYLELLHTTHAYASCFKAACVTLYNRCRRLHNKGLYYCLEDISRVHEDAVTSWDATWQSIIQAHDAAISVERDEKAAVVADLQRAMDELNESRLVLSDDVDRLRLEKQAKVDVLKITRDEFHAQFDELAAEVVKGKAVVDALTLELSTALERTDTLEQHLDESLRQCAQFEAEMERRRKEFVEGRNHLNATVAALTESEQRLQQDVDELSNAKAVANDQVTDLQRQLDDGRNRTTSYT